MKWEKIDNYQEMLQLTRDVSVYIGQYFDNSKTWQVGYDSDIIMVFDCEKRFSKRKCKEYVEKKLKQFYKQLGVVLNANAQSS
jgi:hypothetical protein